MVDRQFSEAVHRRAIKSFNELCELEGRLVLTGLLTREGLALVTDAQGRTSEVELDRWSDEHLAISADDRERMECEFAAQARKASRLAQPS